MFRHEKECVLIHATACRNLGERTATYLHLYEMAGIGKSRQRVG